MKTSKSIRIILHSLFWIGLTIILNSRFLNLEWGPMSRQNDTLLLPLLFGMCINAILFYSNAHWFIPKYLHSKQHKKYWRWAILMVLGLTILELTFDGLYLFQKYLKHALVSLSAEQQQEALLEFVFMFGVIDFITNLFFWLGAFLYRLPKDWLKNERQKQQLAQDKLSAELDFLKAQINPHFLFNGINSIYHLMEDDVKKAQKILSEFSELLRYQLYECKEDFIPIKKELQYVSNYLGIETIRKGEDAIIIIDLPDLQQIENVGNLKIAPLLLSPFLENAFKYLSLYSEKEKNVLEVRLSIENSNLELLVKNTIDSTVHRKSELVSSGIGLKNVKRRLNIMYSDKHHLSIEEEANCFSTNLKINLS